MNHRSTSLRIWARRRKLIAYNFIPRLSRLIVISISSYFFQTSNITTLVIMWFGARLNLIWFVSLASLGKECTLSLLLVNTAKWSRICVSWLAYLAVHWTFVRIRFTHVPYIGMLESSLIGKKIVHFFIVTLERILSKYLVI